MRHRPIGIGVQGLADLFAELHYDFEGEKARKLNREVFETIYYSSLEMSNELAKEQGPYETCKYICDAQENGSIVNRRNCFLSHKICKRNNHIYDRRDDSKVVPFQTLFCDVFFYVHSSLILAKKMLGLLCTT